MKFKINNSGISQEKSHVKGVTHQDKERVRRGKTNQRVFVISSEFEELTLSTSKINLVLTHEDKVIKAETIQPLDFIQSNYSFASAANDSKKFRIMFPDSEIAKSYSQGETKVNYVIQFGIAPYIKQCIPDNIKRKPFSFLLNETNTQQVKKQFDAYLQYWSSENQISNIYYGSCFVGHCNSDQLFYHFHHFIKELELNPNLLLHLGMDGPNANLKFQQDLAKYFDEKVVSLLNIDTSSA